MGMGKTAMWVMSDDAIYLPQEVFTLVQFGSFWPPNSLQIHYQIKKF